MPRCTEESDLTRVRRRRGAASPALLGVVAAAALVLASCVTVPQRAPSEWLGVLPSDATLYASLDVTANTTLIKKALKDAGPDFADVITLMDMTKRLVASVTLVPGGGSRFSAAALGSYPSGIIGARLGGNKDWKKQSSAAGGWWQWSKAGLQMSIPNNGILLASNGDVETLLGRWQAPPALTVPPDVADDMKTGDLVVYLPELPGGLSQSAAQNSVRIPLQEVWLKAVKAAAGYDVGGTANTGTERDAKVLTLALRLGLVAWLRSENVPNLSDRLKSITVTAQGVQVKLAGLHFTEDEIIPMFLSLVKGLSDGTTETPATDVAPADSAG
jgi:hypothetical protein